MISRYGIYLPIPVVAALVALVYGLSIHRGLISALLTFALVMIGGWIYGAIGQLIGVIVSALVIFFAFALPEHRHQAQESAKREREITRLRNEEDM